MSLAEVGEADAKLQAALAGLDGEEDDITASLAAVTAQMHAETAPAGEEAAAEAEAAPAGADAEPAPEAVAAADAVPELSSMAPPVGTTMCAPGPGVWHAPLSRLTTLAGELSLTRYARPRSSCSETLFSYLGSGGESTLGSRLAELFSCTLSAAITAAEVRCRPHRAALNSRRRAPPERPLGRAALTPHACKRRRTTRRRRSRSLPRRRRRLLPRTPLPTRTSCSPRRPRRSLLRRCRACGC